MGDKTKIDKLFEDGLNDFEASPQSDSWARIHATLEKKQQKKRALIWRWASIAAAVVLAFYTGYYFNDNTETENYPETINQPVPAQPDYISGKEKNESTKKEESVVSDTKQPRTTKSNFAPSKKVVKNSSKPGHNTAAKTEERITSSNIAFAKTKQEENAITENDGTMVPNLANDYSTQIVNLKKETAVEDEQNQALDGPIEQPTTSPSAEEVTTPTTETLDYTESVNKSKPPFPRFAISAMASPTFPFTDVTVNDPDQATQNNVDQEKLKSSYSYGLGLGYRISKKLELQTGIMVNNWKQEATGVRLRVSPSSITSSNTNVDANGNTSLGNLNFNELTDPTNQGKLQTANVGGQTYSVLPGLKESYQFIEVPITIGYYLIDTKRWYVKANIGLNSRFVTNSEATLLYADGSEVPYENLALESYTMQLIGGAGAGVKFGKHWGFGLHPTLLYGITKVNSHNEVNTYFHQVLIYSCLSYSF